MLKELLNARQHPGEMHRRWFQDGDMELIVWINEAGEVDTFELSCDIGTNWRVLRWNPQTGLQYLKVRGDQGKAHKPEAVPVLVPSDEPFPAGEIARSFQARSQTLDTTLRQFIFEKIQSASS